SGPCHHLVAVVPWSIIPLPALFRASWVPASGGKGGRPGARPAGAGQGSGQGPGAPAWGGATTVVAFVFMAGWYAAGRGGGQSGEAGEYACSRQLPVILPLLRGPRRPDQERYRTSPATPRPAPQLPRPAHQAGPIVGRPGSSSMTAEFRCS